MPSSSEIACSVNTVEPRYSSLITAVTLIALWRVPWMCKILSLFYSLSSPLWLFIHWFHDWLQNVNNLWQDASSQSVWKSPQLKLNISEWREQKVVSTVEGSHQRQGEPLNHPVCPELGLWFQRDTQGAPTPAKLAPLLAYEPHPCHI